MISNPSIKSNFQGILPLFVCCILFFSCSSTSGPGEGLPEPNNGGVEVTSQTLKDKASFGIGAAVTHPAIEKDPLYKEVLIDNFSQITGETGMKMNRIWESSDTFNWGKADALMDFAEANDLQVHGHTLVWYKAFPDWFVEAKYDSASFEMHIKHYITEVVGRYKGRIRSWDVVNEVFADGGDARDEEVIKTVFKDPIAFYARCFQYASAADPEALLFYNDYNVVLDSGKRKAIKAMVARFEKEGIPINGLGDQFHYMESTNKNQIRTGFEDMASTGLLMHISELDIRMNLSKSDAYVFTEAEQKKQASTYQRIVEMYEALPQAQKFAITTWGVSDRESWLLDWWHKKEYPLLFDADFQKKEAYYGFMEGLK